MLVAVFLKSTKMRTKIYLYFGLFALIIVGAISIGVYNDTKISIVKNCKVIELQQQQLITGGKDNMRTEIRYLVITDKETFICESSMLNGKFDNSNVFWHLKKDKTYTFKVCGVGKGFLFDYRNVIKETLT